MKEEELGRKFPKNLNCVKNVTLQASNRELIRLCYDINYISDDEFLLPYTGYEFQNLRTSV